MNTQMKKRKQKRRTKAKQTTGKMSMAEEFLSGIVENLEEFARQQTAIEQDTALELILAAKGGVDLDKLQEFLDLRKRAKSVRKCLLAEPCKG
jgi:hypothetical protein